MSTERPFFVVIALLVTCTDPLRAHERTQLPSARPDKLAEEPDTRRCPKPRLDIIRDRLRTLTAPAAFPSRRPELSGGRRQAAAAGGTSHLPAG